MELVVRTYRTNPTNRVSPEEKILFARYRHGLKYREKAGMPKIAKNTAKNPKIPEMFGNNSNECSTRAQPVRDAPRLSTRPIVA